MDGGEKINEEENWREGRAMTQLGHSLNCLPAVFLPAPFFETIHSLVHLYLHLHLIFTFTFTFTSYSSHCTSCALHLRKTILRFSHHYGHFWLCQLRESLAIHVKWFRPCLFLLDCMDLHVINVVHSPLHVSARLMPLQVSFPSFNSPCHECYTVRGVQVRFGPCLLSPLSIMSTPSSG